MPGTLTPKSVPELVKLLAKYGKKAYFVSGIDPSTDKAAAGKAVIDLTGIAALNEVLKEKTRIVIGTGMNLGRLAREVAGENGLLQQASSIIANPLVRNRVTFVQALDPDSPYFDITTPLVLLEAKVRIQTPTAKRTVSIRDFLETASKGLKKGEIPVAVEFSRLPPEAKVGFFRVVRTGGKGSVSAAARMKLVRGICVDPEIVVSSLTLIPLRAKGAEKEIEGKQANENSIKRAAEIAADEILELAEKANSYERTLIEITVARTLRSIMEGSIPT